ncbi:MAG TPA: TlpA disulfide reductase family protein [Chitinophagales bacterium]|nr:TlpA disulfide reductase family protein [Chitinophagales bacterium]
MIKKIPTVIFFFLLSTSFYSPVEKSAKKILEASVKTVTNASSGSYVINQKFKYFFKTDTTNHSAKVLYERTNSALEKWSFKFNEQNDSFKNYAVYDGKNLLIVSSYDSTAKYYNGAKYDFSTANWSFENLFFNTLMDPKKLQGLLEPDKIDSITRFPDEEVNNELCFVLQFHDKDYPQQQMKNGFLKYFIRQKDFLPVKRIYRVEYQDQFQWSDETISDFRLGNVTPSTFDIEHAIFPSYYQARNIDSTTAKKKREPLLAAGAMAPEWKLPSPWGDSISLTQFKGKTVILDFWYIGCFPCLKTYPVMDSLYKKYENQNIVILGMDAYDTSAAKIKEFLSKRNIRYPQTMNAKIVASQYHVHGYPTMYVIDGKGIIRHSNAGYYEGLRAELDSVINALK